MIMRDLRMAVSLPANEAKECRPGERAGARNTTSRYGLSSLISFNPLSRYETFFTFLLANMSFSSVSASYILDILSSQTR